MLNILDHSADFQSGFEITGVERFREFGSSSCDCYPLLSAVPCCPTTLGEERRENTYLRVGSLQDWMRFMG